MATARTTRRQREGGSLTACKARAVAPVFLIGGGREAHAVRASHAGFVRAAAGGPIAALIVDEGEHTDPDRWSAALALAGAREVRELVVSVGAVRALIAGACRSTPAMNWYA